MKHIHRHRLALVKIQPTKNRRTGEITSFRVVCLDCIPPRVGTVKTYKAASELRAQHRAEIHPNGIESHRASELAKEYKDSWR